MRTSVNPSTRSNDFKATEELVTPKASSTPSANTIFTEDAAAKAREILRRKLRNLRKKTPGLKKDGSYYLDKDGVLMQHNQGAGFPVKARGKGVDGGKRESDIAHIRSLSSLFDRIRGELDVEA